MNILLQIVNWIILSITANSALILKSTPIWVNIPLGVIMTLYFLIFNIFPSVRKYPTPRLKVLGDGAELILSFWVSCAVSAPLVGISIGRVIAGRENFTSYLTYWIILFICEFIIFWNGIIRVYVTSVQLGIRHRVMGLLLGMIPIANLAMLMKIYIITRREADFETEKHKINESRKSEKICATKYPILLVHGVFFRDSRILNYWGRIPTELQKNGAVICYGNQQSALSVEQSAEELARKIKEIVETSGCGRVNIIAHSKGGLDSRYAITKLGCAPYVASLTTINTPHKGCLFAEYLLGSCPARLKNFIENTYNKVFYHLGDSSPNFMAAVRSLTNSSCEKFNEEVPDSPEVMYQSYGSKATNRRSGRFPLNVSYPVVKKYDGDNDGLVALTSASWGERFTPIYPTGRRGITHADMIDLNREDIKGFDVREFYVQMVAELKRKGY